MQPVVDWSEAGKSLTHDLTGHMRTKEGHIIPKWKEKKREK